MSAFFPLRTVTDRFEGGSGARNRDNKLVRPWQGRSLTFTCRNRDSPSQPVAMRLIRVEEPEVVIRPRKSIGELNRISDVARRDCCVRRRIAIGRIIHQTIESVLLFVHIGDFYHEVSTKAVLQQKSKQWIMRSPTMSGGLWNGRLETFFDAGHWALIVATHHKQLIVVTTIIYQAGNRSNFISDFSFDSFTAHCAINKSLSKRCDSRVAR